MVKVCALCIIINDIKINGIEESKIQINLF